MSDNSKRYAVMRLHEDLTRARLDALDRGVSSTKVEQVFRETSASISKLHNREGQD